MILNPTEAELAEVTTGVEANNTSIEGPHLWPFAEAATADVTVKLMRMEPDEFYVQCDVQGKYAFNFCGLIAPDDLKALIEGLVLTQAKIAA